MSDPLLYHTNSTCDDCAAEIVRRVFPKARARSESTKTVRAIVAGEISRFISVKSSGKFGGETYDCRCGTRYSLMRDACPSCGHPTPRIASNPKADPAAVVGGSASSELLGGISINKENNP